MLSDEQSSKIKEEIIQQIKSTFPEDKKESAINQVNSMNNEQLEQFLEQNNLIKNQNQQQCIFCSIIFGDTKSYKIEENEKSIAILEINPISKGHTLIVPKEHISSPEKLPKEMKTLEEQITKKIKSKLKPKEVKTFSSNLFGHEIINILPIYNNETPESKRNQAKPEELEQLQQDLEKNKQRENKSKKPKTKKIKEKIWLPKRIP